MILTDTQEIASYLPTSKWRDAQTLLAYTEEEESNVLLPVLGQELLDWLTEQYDNLVAEQGGITSQQFPVDKVDDTVRLIRICQSHIQHHAQRVASFGGNLHSYQLPNSCYLSRSHYIIQKMGFQPLFPQKR